MDENNQAFTSEISVRIKELRIQHRHLNIEIDQLMDESPNINQLLMQKLKKQRLWLKDTIVKLESKRIPDMDA